MSKSAVHSVEIEALLQCRFIVDSIMDGDRRVIRAVSTAHYKQSLRGTFVGSSLLPPSLSLSLSDDLFKLLQVADFLFASNSLVHVSSL